MVPYEIVLGFLGLQVLMAAIMAFFPGDEGMRSKTGIASYTPSPKSAGDYIFNGLVLLLAGGALFMEFINESIEKKPWLTRVGIRLAVLSSSVALILFLTIMVAAFSE